MPLNQLSCFGDTAPSQIVDHLARDAEEKILIRVAEKVQGDPPAFFGLGDIATLLAHLLKHQPQPLMEDEMTQTLANCLDKLDLPLEKGPVVSLGGGLSVGHKDPAQHRVMDAEIGALEVRSFFEIGG